MKITDFKIIRVIGKGGFGEVRLCRHKASGRVFAGDKRVKQLRSACAYLLPHRDVPAQSSVLTRRKW